MEATAAALQKYQMEGQDLPWLLAHRAEHRAEHVALIWDPPVGMPYLDLPATLARRAPTGCRPSRT